MEASSNQKRDHTQKKREEEEETKSKPQFTSHSIYYAEKNVETLCKQFDQLEKTLPTFLKDDYIILETLGKGASCEVKLAFHKKKGIYVSLKFYKLQRGDTLEDLKCSIMLEHLLMLNIDEIKTKHKSKLFLPYFGLLKDPEPSEARKCDIILVMKSGCTSLENLLDGERKYPPKSLLYLLKIFSQGFGLLQENIIAHRDIKPRNLVIYDDDQDHQENEFIYNYAIIDFGISCRCSKEGTAEYGGSTPGFESPELIEIKEMDDSPKYDPFKADVFALAVTILKLSGNNVNYTEQLKSLEKNNEAKELVAILSRMLEADPLKRCSFKEVEKFIDQIKIAKPNSQLERKAFLLSQQNSDLKSIKTQEDFEATIEKKVNLYESYIKMSYLNRGAFQLTSILGLLEKLRKKFDPLIYERITSKFSLKDSQMALIVGSIMNGNLDTADKSLEAYLKIIEEKYGKENIEKAAQSTFNQLEKWSKGVTDYILYLSYKGQVLTLKKDFKKAEEFLTLGMVLQDKIGSEITTLYDNYMTLLIFSQRYEEIVPVAEKMLKLLGNEINMQSLAPNLYLGGWLTKQGKSLEKAEKHLTRARAIAENFSGGNDQWIASVYLALLENLRAQKKPTGEIEKLLEKARKNFEKIEGRVFASEEEFKKRVDIFRKI